MLSERLLERLLAADTREVAWSSLINDQDLRVIAEVGVYRGGFAQAILDRCTHIERYYMIDPWRHLADWNKPANNTDEALEALYVETLRRTSDHESKRVVLRGRTIEVSDQIPDESVDLAYIDGDHTLRGIATDLIRMWPKIRLGGFVGGDDLKARAFHHGKSYEPTFVFPFVVYFAEAVGAPLYALPHDQFLIRKVPNEHRFTDLVGSYGDITVRAAVSNGPWWRGRFMNRLRHIARGAGSWDA